MRRSTWIPLLGVIVAVAVIAFIALASRPGEGPVTGDVAEGNGVEQDGASGAVTVTNEAGTATPEQTDGDQAEKAGE